MPKRISFPENTPVYDDLGRITAIGSKPLPRPANATEIALAQMMAAQASLIPPLKAQTNEMDEAYNKTLFVKPKVNKNYKPSLHEEQNRIIQKALLELYGVDMTK